MIPDHRTIRIEAHQRRAQAHLDRQAVLARRERKLAERAATRQPVFTGRTVRRRLPAPSAPITAVRGLVVRIRRVRRPAGGMAG